MRRMGSVRERQLNLLHYYPLLALFRLFFTSVLERKNAANGVGP
jgi:hypothetical protein